MKQVPLDKANWAYAPTEPDPDFDPIHNQRVIDETIRENDLMASRKSHEYREKVRERAEAVAKYIKGIDDGKTNASVLEYFGRQELSRLRGEELLDEVRGKLGEELKKKLSKKIRNPNFIHA